MSGETFAALVSISSIVIGSLMMAIVAWERRETRRDREWRS